MDQLIQLYPLPTQEVPFKGAYLAHDLRQQAQQSGQPFVYGNFVTSIDGRIAIPHPNDQGLMVPKNVANDRDWRLFQELAAQADLIISSGRYLREWARGKAQEILQIDDPRFADLRAWRQERGLKPQADIAIISRSLRFPLPGVLKASGRKVVVFTTDNPDPARIDEIEAQAGQVIVAGAGSVDGRLMVEHLARSGYQTIYSAAGPQILHLLLAGGVLDRLYLTHANRLLGGWPYASIVEGPLLDPPVDLTLNTIYLDPQGLDGLGQLFISYNRT
ncbi:MAG: dihydrofolate reductase family protein [Chloroflexi bacterium]|nr:dihydrofolate reductase family protein [Chloroflexota bacterium]MCI0579424.1 dihydrofolate reductase family protein [Chloroflexota bacterium]MCI0643367.1 dihydrofolate reductase family protein [Chloroflexota bacterium]MCI0730068.1 dihydrofolate reductase family protein [Chloroflexota bacterium]